MSVSRKLREIACACSGEGGRDWPHDNLIALAQELETIATLMANKVAFADDVDDDELTEWASRLSHLQPQPKVKRGIAKVPLCICGHPRAFHEYVNGPGPCDCWDPKTNDDALLEGQEDSLFKLCQCSSFRTVQPPYEEPDVDHDVSLDDLRDIADGKTQHDDD